MPHSATVPGFRTWVSFGVLVLPPTGGSEAASGSFWDSHSHSACVMLGIRISSFSQPESWYTNVLISQEPSCEAGLEQALSEGMSTVLHPSKCNSS